MSRKTTIISTVLAVLVGAGLGAGGTIGFQSVFGSSEQTESVVKKGGPLLSLDVFTVNLQGGYVLRTEITIQVADAKAEALLKEKVPYLRDRVIAALSYRPVADVQGQEAQNRLKEELLRNLNEVGENKITDVLFGDFIYN